MTERNDDENQSNFNCYEWMTNQAGKSKHVIYNVATIVAVALAIVALLLVNKDEATLNKSGAIQSLRAKIKPCLTNVTYPVFLRRIHELTIKIETIKTNVIREMGEVKSLLENNITDVEGSLNKRLTVVQSQISNLKTNVNKLQTNFGTFRDLTNTKFKQVWDKFDQIEKEIAQKRGKN